MTKEKRKIAVFDVDGTLIDSLPKVSEDIRKVFLAFGHDVSEEEINQLSWYDLAKDYGISEYEFDSQFSKRKTWKESLNEGEISLFPETRECLEKLAKEDIGMAILSKSTPEYTKTKLNHFDIAKYFEVVETIHPKEPSKLPSARKIIDRLGPKTIQEMYFIGDREEDVNISDDISREYELSSQGIYVNRQGEILRDHSSVKNLHQLNDLILKK